MHDLSVNRKQADLASEIDGSHRWWQKLKHLRRSSVWKTSSSRTRMPRQWRTSLIRHQESKSSRWFFAKQCTDCTGDSGFVNAVPGTPYPLPDGAATFTFPPISESLVLRKLLRLRPIMATADSLFCNRFLQRCALFLASSITFLFSLSLSTSSFPNAWKLCKGHPSVQTPRQPVRSVQLPANITLSSDRETDGWHPELPSRTFHYIQQVNLKFVQNITCNQTFKKKINW